jgi:hypothetical protein
MRKPEEFTILETLYGINVYLTSEVSSELRTWSMIPDYKVRTATEADWKLLEERYYYFSREPLPADWPIHEDHFAHPCQDKIRFRDERGRLVTMKPGRYIAKFYPTHDAARYSALWHDWYQPAVLQFAKTADEIEEVYVNGPESCMSKECFDSCIHPVRVYGDSDLQLAYARRGDRITARALVWPERKIHGRIYGDEDRLSAALEAAGYKEGKFQGARIRRILENGQYVVPYLDWVQSARDDGDWLVIDRNGDIDCDVTDGLSGESGEYCSYYDEYRDEETSSVRTSLSGNYQTWCQTAVEQHAFWCDHTGDYWHETLGLDMADGSVWSPARFEAEGGVCSQTDERHPLTDLILTADGELWSKEHFENTPEAERPALEMKEAA